jgi:hypothetical protein
VLIAIIRGYDRQKIVYRSGSGGSATTTARMTVAGDHGFKDRETKGLEGFKRFKRFKRFKCSRF